MPDQHPSLPRATKVPHTMTHHGDTRTDNYFWMRERDSDEVLSYLNAENEYKTKRLQHTEDFQRILYDEMVSRIKKDDESVPYFFNGYHYLSRYEKGKEYPIYSRRKESIDANDEIYLDVNQLSKDREYCQVGNTSISDDNTVLAFAVDFVGRRQYTLRFRELGTDKDIPEEIANTTGAIAWAADNKTVFYALKNPDTLRAEKIMRHTLGTDPTNDVEVFHEQDDTFGTSVYRSKSRDYLVIVSYATLTNEYQILKSTTPTKTFQTFHPRERGLEYSVSHFEDRFFVVTNDKAKNFRVMTTPVEQTQKDNWVELIAHREDTMVEGLEVFQHFLVVKERTQGLTQLRIRPKDGAEYYMQFPEETYDAGLSANPEFNTNLVRFSYTSLTTPSSTFDFDMKTQEKVLLKQQEVIGGYDQSLYQSKRVWATASDGVKIPISLVYRKDTFKGDGSNPALLYGYGSYGITVDPYFSTVRLSLLDRGFVYAIAHVRGSEYLGRPWYEDGKLLNKQNTFTDFLAAADFLAAEKLTNPDRLAAMGGSAGGLLMGAVMNMGPKRFRAIAAAVPFVDVVTTMLDDSIPLTTGEYDEWGNPNEKQYYDYMKTYSPYDNVTAQDYPAILVTTGYHDSQVQYWEPAKWVAKLREFKTDSQPLLFHCEMKTGHSGASGRFERLKTTALEFAFLMDQLGVPLK